MTLLGALSVTPNAVAAASTMALPPVHVHACSARIVCGSIVVPRFWSHPDGHTYTVHFRIFRNADRSLPALEPLVGFEGGPGYPSIGSANAYRLMQGSLIRRHPLIVMDNRGTGSSGAIACRNLQQGIGSFVGAVATCAAKLGAAANSYGTAAVADDLHAILHGLHIPKVDVYGDSYGSYTAQVFTIRYPSMVRAAIYDGAYNNNFSPFETEASTALRASWKRLCLRAGTCRGILARIGRFARRLEAHPVVGVGHDADGNLVHVRLTAGKFAGLVTDATYSDTYFRDLPAALRAFDHGDRTPLLRLAAEDVSFTATGGSPGSYSQGDYMAVYCHDQPTAWDPAANLATRRTQLAAAIAALPRDAFAPFSFPVWLNSLYESQLVRGCLKWPAPTISDPPFPPPGTPYPHVPVLVLNGGFDQATPAPDARRVAASFPNATFVLMHNAGHVTAVYDYENCASVIARRFLQTRHAGDTSCATHLPAVNVVKTFPLRLAGAPMGVPTVGDHSAPIDRRAAWVAQQTVGDAMVRWYNLMYGVRGMGLRGGTFTVAGPYLSTAPLTFRFDRDRFTRDLATSGTATWSRATYRLRASLRIDGPGNEDGFLFLTCVTDRAGARARVSGMLGGRHVSLIVPVPWSP